MENDADSPFTRRAFVASMLATGFALAVRPISAQTITTPSQGLTAGEARIPVADGEIPAYFARPQQTGRFPIVLVVQEIFGVHEHIRDICRRLADLGYLAVAPELFLRQGDVAHMQEMADIAKVVSRVPDAQVMADLDATAAWAAGTGQGDSGRLGVTGFCWGGRITWLYCAHNPAVRAGVAWYGRLSGVATELQPKYPLDLAASIKCPVLGLYGGADASIPQQDVERMRAALKSAGSQSEIVVYPDAPHAFFADYRPSYRKEAAADGWRRLQSWFRAHGVV